MTGRSRDGARVARSPGATDRLHYQAVGEGPAVVLLHSFLCSGAMWSEQVEALAREHRVLNVDLGGHGASPAVQAPVDLEALLVPVFAVLEAEGIEQAHWAGLSIGGMLALRAALAAPERVRSLLLLDTDAGPERRPARFEYRLLGTVVRVLGMRPVLPSVCRKMFGRSTLRHQPDLVREWRSRFAAIDVPSSLAILEALIRRRDLVPRLPEISAPALVLVGAEDRSLPPERSLTLAEGLPNGRYVEVPLAGHLSALEQPDRVTEAMLEHLRTH